VRRRLDAFALDFHHGVERALLRGAARAKRHGNKARLERRKLRACVAQLLGAFRRLGREEFETEL